MNTQNSISDTDTKRILRACKSPYNKLINGQEANIEFSNSTIVLLNNNPNFRDNNGNSIIHILLQNGYFNKNVLIELLVNGHDINCLDKNNMTPMAYIDCRTYDFIEKFNWMINNGALYFAAKKDNDDKWVNDIEESTKIFLELIAINIYHLSYNIAKNEEIKQKNINNYWSSYNEKSLMIAKHIQNNFDKLCDLFKYMINKQIILNDLSKEPDFMFYNPILLFVPIRYLEIIETIVKLNWDIHNLNPTNFITYTEKRDKLQPKFAYIKSDVKLIDLNNGDIIKMVETILKKANQPKQFATMLSALFTKQMPRYLAQINDLEKHIKNTYGDSDTILLSNKDTILLEELKHKTKNIEIAIKLLNDFV